MSSAKEKLREVSPEQWILGGRYLISRTQTPSANSWSDGDGAFFEMTRAPQPVPPNFELPATRFPVPDHLPASRAIWFIGDAVLKIVPLQRPFLTREHTALEFARGIVRSFDVPEVLFYGEWEGRYYLITTKLPGITLNEAWPKMDDVARADMVDRVAKICKELCVRKGHEMAGVDGGWIPDDWLMSHGGEASYELHPQGLRQTCEKIGFDCSTLVFSHGLLSPDCIVWDSGAKKLGVCDWECAGYAPKEWIRTKFQFHPGLRLETPEHQLFGGDMTSAMQYAYAVAAKLGGEGFGSRMTEYSEWRQALSIKK